METCEFTLLVEMKNSDSEATQSRDRSLVKDVVFAPPYSRIASIQLLPGQAFVVTVCGFSSGLGTGLKVANRRHAVFRASEDGRTRQVPKELVVIGHTPGAKHSTDLVRSGVGAHSKISLVFPLLVKSLEFRHAKLLEFIPKAIEMLLVKATTSPTLEQFADPKVFSQAGEERSFGVGQRGSNALSKNAFGLGKYLRIDGNVYQLERRQVRKHSVIMLEVGFKTRRFGSATIHIAERDQWSDIGGCTRDENRKSVPEIPRALRARGVPRRVVAGEQAVLLEAQSGTEEVEFFALRCQISVLRMGEHEIQSHEFCFDGQGLTPTLVGVVVIGEHLIEGTGTEVIDQRPICRAVDPDVTFREASLDQTLGASA